jgi:sortase (surface protein transpeptidase)
MQVGRWVGGAEPGEQGAVFLDGHVDGVFARLSGVTIGQIVSVSYGGQVYIYRVVHMETVALEGIDMRRALSVYGGASEGLNMMTCAGTFVPSMDTYDQRLVVYAVRV